jgi:hypothetical protein
MLIYVFLVISLPSLAGGQQWQKWTGTFSTVGSTCNPATCCCLTGNMVLTWSPGTLHVAATFSGARCGPLSTVSISTAYPSGSTLLLTPGGQPTVLTLSADSLIITSHFPASTACNERLHRISWLPCLHPTQG